MTSVELCRPDGETGTTNSAGRGLGPHPAGEPAGGVAGEHLRARLSVAEGGRAHSRPHDRVDRRRIGEPRRPDQPERARPAVVAVDERERNVVTRALQRIDRGVQHHRGIGGQRGPLGERTHRSIPPGDDHLGGRLGDDHQHAADATLRRRGRESSRTSSRPPRGARCGTPAPAGPRSSSTACGSSRRRSGARRSARSPASSRGRAAPWRPGACPRRSWAGRRRCRPGSARGPTRGTSGGATGG